MWQSLEQRRHARRERGCQDRPEASAAVRRTRPSGARPALSPAHASSFRQLLSGGADLLIDIAAIDRVAVAGERPRPGRDRIVEPRELEEHVAVMILNDR